jgi:RNA 3'-phosphate cyclase
MIEIDASLGEGGGQILRSALTLSVLTRQPVYLFNIRVGRPKPGLASQHLHAVEAAARISGGTVEGNSLGSTQLTFIPNEVQPGRYRFAIDTAGSTSLVLQTIFLPLAFGQTRSSITIKGGTHVPWSPSFHYLAYHWLAVLQEIGFKARVGLDQAGFYPQGQGQIQAEILPSGALHPLQRVERGSLVRIQGISAVANLDLSIARRQKLQALRQLEPICRDTKIETLDLPASTKGTVLYLQAQFENCQAAFSALGAPDKRAEAVADEAVEQLLGFLHSDGAIDSFLADQLLLPLAFIPGLSEFRTSKVTQHLLTNAAIIGSFLPTEITIEGELGQPATVRILSTSLLPGKT